MNMNYRDKERARAHTILSDVIRAKGNGRFAGRQYEFVLDKGELNLWDGIREDALEYFKRNSIAWWRGGPENLPNGHLLSSQVACLNHLYWLRTRKDAALAVAKNLHPNIYDIEIMDDGYVEFEVVAKENHLCERSHSRGANATTFDAAMIGKKHDGNNLLMVIEWKYTEKYDRKCRYKSGPAEIYDRHLAAATCPIRVQNKEALYYEPYYQLMRQTLLSWKMTQAGEYGADEYIHIHVIPTGNKALLDANTSPLLKGHGLREAWKSVLHEPEKYVVLDPQDLLAPAISIGETKSIIAYLQNRYWDKPLN